VFFIDKDTPDNRFGRHVFISSQEGLLESVTTAQQGRIELTGNDRFLILEKGQQWQTNRETGETRLTQFEHYELLIDEDVNLPSSGFTSRLTPTWELIKNPSRDSWAELSWRLGLGLAGINLLLIALAVSAVNPRAGRSYHLGLALFVFIAYYNMLNVGQSWISTGRFAFAPFMVVLHGGVFLMAMLWLSIRHYNWSWRFLWPSRNTSTQGAA
jgi:lipopolysaccharide export system permease protein